MRHHALSKPAGAPMQCRTFPLGPLDTNCYLIHTEKEALIVDPGGPADPLLAFLKKNNLTLSAVFLTHLHFDHVYGVSSLLKATGALAFASEADRWMLDSELGRGGVWDMPKVDPYEFSPLDPGERTVLGATCKILPTPGHTPGGLCFYFAKMGAVYAGDSLFYRSIGRTDFPHGSHEVLLHSIRDQLFSLPEETIVYPGHGQATSIGDEMRNNPYASDFRLL